MPLISAFRVRGRGISEIEASLVYIVSGIRCHSGISDFSQSALKSTIFPRNCFLSRDGVWR